MATRTHCAHRYFAPLAKYSAVCITYQPPLVFCYENVVVLSGTEHSYDKYFYISGSNKLFFELHCVLFRTSEMKLQAALK